MISEEYSDLERDAVAYLQSRLADLPGDVGPVTVGVGLPEGWSLGSVPHVQVAVDGSREVRGWSEHGALVQTSTLRATAWAEAPSTAKRLARLMRSALLSYPARPGLGVVAASDEATRATIAGFTVLIDQRPL